jgi:hypothetical protein
MLSVMSLTPIIKKIARGRSAITSSRRTRSLLVVSPPIPRLAIWRQPVRSVQGPASVSESPSMTIGAVSILDIANSPRRTS